MLAEIEGEAPHLDGVRTPPKLIEARGRMSSMAADLRLALDVDQFARCAGLEGPLDDWQRRVLEGDDRKILLNCCRQSGKSTVAGLLACRTAIYEPGSLVLCVSPSLRQSERAVPEGAGLPATRSRASRRCTRRAR